MKVEDIAKVCHEVNRAYCLSLGDNSQKPWEEAEGWQQYSAKLGVEAHIDNPSMGAPGSHEAWMAQKLADGWKYGEVKDAEAKTHPCMVPFSELPASQQAKDYIFAEIVHQLKDL